MSLWYQQAVVYLNGELLFHLLVINQVHFKEISGYLESYQLPLEV